MRHVGTFLQAVATTTFIEPASLDSQTDRSIGTMKRLSRRSFARAPDLFGAAPVEFGDLPMLLLSGGSIGRLPASTTSQNATGRSPLEVASLQPQVANLGKSLISARCP